MPKLADMVLSISNFLRKIEEPRAMAIPIFPLKAVLFPGGILPLKIFEQRYIEMTKECLKDNVPFGICLIREGEEVGTAALAEEIGCLAKITDWDMQEGLLNVKAEGIQRFRIVERQVAANGLVTANVSLLAAEPENILSSNFHNCVQILQKIIEKAGVDRFPDQLKFTDASWVSYRLAEVLPIKLAAKQTMLEINDSGVRLQVLQKFLIQQGLC